MTMRANSVSALARGVSRTAIRGFVIGCAAACAFVAAAPAQAAPNGLDSSFGRDGKVATDFAGMPDEATAVVLQSDGKIVAVGNAWSEAPAVPFIARDFGGCERGGDRG